MFERWTDVVGALGLALGTAYVVWEISRRQRKLQELINVLDGSDAAVTTSLEELVRAGELQPMSVAGAV